MRIVDYISWVVPWSAPVATAYIVWDASIRLLGLPWFVAVFAAIALEGLGLTTVTIALVLWNYNQSKRKIDPAAPTWLAIALIAVYFTVALTLTVILKILPHLAVYALAVFPVLSILGMIAIALISDHRRRLAAILSDRELRKQQRASQQLLAQAKKELHVCKNCGKEFANRFALNAHQRAHNKD